MPGSGNLWHCNKYPTIACAPNITGLSSPFVPDFEASPIRRDIKSLERPLSPAVGGAHNYEKKRHQLYPKTD